ncbi:MAG: DUF2188 domain-containing protein [Armatimonadota bacterium]
MRRVQYFVVLLNTEQWGVRDGSTNTLISVKSTQAAAIESARLHALAIYHAGGLSQVLIQGRDGKFRTEYTYGNDPRAIPG